MSEYILSWDFVYYSRKAKKTQKSIYKEQLLVNFSTKEVLWTYLEQDDNGNNNNDGSNNDKSLNDLV